MRVLLFFTAILLTIGLSAQTTSTATDSVCVGELDVVYGILNPSPNSTYTWSLSDPAAGTIDSAIVAGSTDSIIQIDWSTVPGTYTLYAIETTWLGCVGDTVMVDVIIRTPPSVTLIGDSICSNTISQFTLDFTGEGPWVFDYTDGTNTYTDTATATPHTVSLPPYSVNTNITITALSDTYGCVADPTTLPTTTIYTFGKPATGAIFHY